MRLMLRLCYALTFILLTTSLFATDYVFTGNGSWTDPNNWQDGAIPLSNPQGNTIIIKGVALNGFYACSINPDPSQPCAGFNQAQDALYSNYGTIIIEAGGSLTLQNFTQFSNGGAFIVYGTLINKTKFEAYESGSITVYGTF